MRFLCELVNSFKFDKSLFVGIINTNEIFDAYSNVISFKATTLRKNVLQNEH